ncbi:MAG: YCF48-related protein [Gammaproteobacteria bacterium]|nr:YCF48-related protein [Gammaproteobacteria bacterium]
MLALGALILLAPLRADPVPVAPEPAVEAPLAPRSLLLGGARAGQRLVTVGERGHILYSDDGGTSWRQAPVPTQATLTAVHFEDALRGWAVGHDSVILHTEDGGETWRIQNFAPQDGTPMPLMDVWFADDRHGYALGAYGLFLETADGGQSWEQRAISADDFHLNHLSDAGGGRLYIAAEFGNVYRSDDGGATWIATPAPYEGSFMGSLALDGDSVLVFGLRGHLFRSDDAGASWTALDTGTTALLTGAARLEDGTIVVTGVAGTLLVSDDDGRSFRLAPRTDRSALAGIIEAGAERLVLFGERGVDVLARSRIR